MTEAVRSLRTPHHHINCTKLTNEEKLLLDLPVSRVDIERAFKSFKPLKAPGPDGLHPVFFQKFWDTIGDSTTSFILDIFHLRKMPFETNATLVCLIPKVTKPESIHQFSTYWFMQYSLQSGYKDPRALSEAFIKQPYSSSLS
jgi:hypothetical protein